MKEEILAKTTPLGGKPGRHRPGDRLLTFLQNLMTKTMPGDRAAGRAPPPTLTGLSLFLVCRTRNSPEPGIVRHDVISECT